MNQDNGQAISEKNTIGKIHHFAVFVHHTIHLCCGGCRSWMDKTKSLKLNTKEGGAEIRLVDHHFTTHLDVLRDYSFGLGEVDAHCKFLVVFNIRHPLKFIPMWKWFTQIGMKLA